MVSGIDGKWFMNAAGTLAAKTLAQFKLLDDCKYLTHIVSGSLTPLMIQPWRIFHETF